MSDLEVTGFIERIKEIIDQAWAHENKSIGILLCADKNDGIVTFSLPENEKNILASKYELYLPTKEQLIQVIENDIQKLEE